MYLLNFFFKTWLFLLNRITLNDVICYFLLNGCTFHLSKGLSHISFYPPSSNKILVYLDDFNYFLCNIIFSSLFCDSKIALKLILPFSWFLFPFQVIFLYVSHYSLVPSYTRHFLFTSSPCHHIFLLKCHRRFPLISISFFTWYFLFLDPWFLFPIILPFLLEYAACFPLKLHCVGTYSPPLHDPHTEN